MSRMQREALAHEMRSATHEKGAWRGKASRQVSKHAYKQKKARAGKQRRQTAGKQGHETAIQRSRTACKAQHASCAAEAASYCTVARAACLECLATILTPSPAKDACVCVLLKAVCSRHVVCAACDGNLELRVREQAGAR